MPMLVLKNILANIFFRPFNFDAFGYLIMDQISVYR